MAMRMAAALRRPACAGSATIGRMRLAVVVSSFFLAATLAAQKHEWRRIDAKGNVVADLSDQRIEKMTSARNGWAVVTFGDVPPPANKGLLAPNGKLLPGRHAYPIVDDAHPILRVAETHAGPSRYFDAEGRELSAEEAERLRAVKPATPPATVRAVWTNMTRPVAERRQVLEVDGKVVSKEYDFVTELPALQCAIVRRQLAAGIVDFRGREVVPPDGTYVKIRAGDPLFAVWTEAVTTLRSPRQAVGFLDRDGKPALPFHFSDTLGFRDGLAWVCKTVRNPDLEGFPWPESWFTDNQLVNRDGPCQEGWCTQSRPTSGKYGVVYQGNFQGGVPTGNGSLCDPARGRFVGQFANGEPNGNGNLFLADGRMYQGTFVDGVLQGYGFSRYRSGLAEFVGDYRDGRPWQGTRYLEDTQKEVELVAGGRITGRAPRGRYTPPIKPVPKPAPGTQLGPCMVCNTTGEVYQDAVYKWVPDTSLILAGSRYFGSSYTHYELDTGCDVEVRPGGYFTCCCCKGRGYVIVN